MTKRSAAGVDNTARRTWDASEYADKAKEREKKQTEEEELTAKDLRKKRRLERDPLHQGLIVSRANLQARDYELNLDAKMGKTQVIGANTPLSQQAGYYCSVCDCALRDSKTYLDHINGKWHQRALGMSMRVERSTVDQVKSRLAMHKERKAQAKDQEDYTVLDGFEAKVKQAEEEERRAREDMKKQKEAEKKDREFAPQGVASELGADEEVIKLMGFGSFA